MLWYHLVAHTNYCWALRSFSVISCLSLRVERLKFYRKSVERNDGKMTYFDSCTHCSKWFFRLRRRCSQRTIYGKTLLQGLVRARKNFLFLSNQVFPRTTSQSLLRRWDRDHTSSEPIRETWITRDYEFQRGETTSNSKFPNIPTRSCDFEFTSFQDLGSNVLKQQEK